MIPVIIVLSYFKYVLYLFNSLARFKKEYQIKKKYAHPLKMFQIYI